MIVGRKLAPRGTQPHVAGHPILAFRLPLPPPPNTSAGTHDHPWRASFSENPLSRARSLSCAREVDRYASALSRSGGIMFDTKGRIFPKDEIPNARVHR